MPRNSSFRYPRTTQERRENQEEYFDGVFLPCRGSRKPHRIIEAWDDIPRSTDRCWKRYRQTQYKPISDHTRRDSTRYAESMSRRNHWHLDHKRCHIRSESCGACIRAGVWREYKKELDRRHRRFLEREREMRLALHMETDWIDRALLIEYGIGPVVK